MPHPLDGPRAKLKRVKYQIKTLDYECQRFFSRQIGGAVIGKTDRKTGFEALTNPIDAPEMPDVPLDWAILVGEIAHNLRSALDGVICQLAIRSNPGSDWRLCKEKRTAFPVFLKGPHAVAKRERFSRKRLAYLRPAYVTRIEGLQPYKRGNGHRRSTLWLLHELNNADKHRLVPVISGWALASSVTPLVGDAKRFSIQAGMQVKTKTDFGEIWKSEDDVYMYAQRRPHIRFGDGCDAVEELPVILTLVRITDSIESIIESFATDFP